ncbi:MAG: hypothetical protein JWN04_2773 [Myxococcaceae bacterium]|nr:hypothetical protein [Myxococcaceae bacterium]
MRVRRIARWLVLLYLASAGLLVLIEQLAIRWHPRDGEVQGSGRDVWLTTEDGLRIYARYYERDPALPVLLYLHGVAGTLASRSDRLELFADLGANLLAVEYRGYGPSEGTPSTRGLELDARAAYAWLRRRTAARKVVPFGESLGGGPASWLASEVEVGGLILLSTSTSLSALASHYMPWLPARWLLRMDFDTLARVARVTTPKLFIHSRADGVVPFAMAEAIYRAAPTPKQHLWLDGIGHDETFYRARPQATEAIREFLRTLPTRGIARPYD